MNPLAWVALGTLPLLVLGSMGIVSTVSALQDPCKTWGDNWGSHQSGGGTSTPSPVEGECPHGTSWTTEAPGRALLDAALMPMAGLLAGALGVVGVRRGSGVALALGGGVMLAVTPLLMLGITIFLAWLPAFSMVMAARAAGLTGRGGMIGLGILLSGLILYAGARVVADITASGPYILLLAVVTLVPFGVTAYLALTKPRMAVAA